MNSGSDSASPFLWIFPALLVLDIAWLALLSKPSRKSQQVVHWEYKPNKVVVLLCLIIVAWSCLLVFSSICSLETVPNICLSACLLPSWRTGIMFIRPQAPGFSCCKDKLQWAFVWGGQNMWTWALFLELVLPNNLETEPKASSMVPYLISQMSENYLAAPAATPLILNFIPFATWNNRFDLQECSTSFRMT